MDVYKFLEKTQSMQTRRNATMFSNKYQTIINKCEAVN